MEIALRVLSGILVSVSISIIVELIVIKKLYPKLKKREDDTEQKAKTTKTVKLDKRLSIIFISLLVFVNIIGVLIIALPKVITEYLEFNYIATVCVWWVFVIFEDVFCYFIFMQAAYDDEKIIVKKLFFKPKEYYYSDITYYSKKGNLRVKTPKGSFVLFNALAGTQSLRGVITQKLNSRDIENGEENSF